MSVRQTWAPTQIDLQLAVTLSEPSLFPDTRSHGVSDFDRLLVDVRATMQ
jgi:hypothetical protein